MINFTKLASDKDQVWFQTLFDRSIKESFLLHKASEFFDPPPCPLFVDDAAGKRINDKFSLLCRKLGDVPEVFLITDGASPKDKYDNLTSYAVTELVSLFHRARTSVVKAHSMFVAQWILLNAPKTIEGPLAAEQLAVIAPIVREEFWNHAETAYIRLASLWDRAGQLLDYVFFNIRQFDRDGFPSILDRIKINFAILDSTIEARQFWKDLKSYAYNEQTDGLKWLLRRRNLLVHSLHLGEPEERAKEEMDIRYYYNHLAEATRHKLGTLSPDDELKCLHSHLIAFARLLEPLCDLCLWGAELIHEMRKEKDWIIS